MRTTLSLDDDVLREVKVYAEVRGIALGKAVSELVRKGLNAPLRTRMVNGLHVIDLPSGSPAIPTKRVLELEAEEE